MDSRPRRLSINTNGVIWLATYELATFAGGCFWCMVAPFQEKNGVDKVVSGYTGGSSPKPSYEQVCSGRTGHSEAVQITFDPRSVGYEELLDIFFRQIDPTDPDGQFYDRGLAYQTAIFYHDESQREIAEKFKQNLNRSERFNKPVVTKILPAGDFYPAEEYHQDYHLKNPDHYAAYRKGSGREKFIGEYWDSHKTKGQNKPSRDELKTRLTPLQYTVTQENGTEPPFNNQYWDNHRQGLYVDIISGEPLFSSEDKFESGSGWPSFSKPIDRNGLAFPTDSSHNMIRTEVRSRKSDSHLGHVFPDGPAPDNLRYCINSASLRFIPREDLKKEGYGQYLSLFEK